MSKNLQTKLLSDLIDRAQTNEKKLKEAQILNERLSNDAENLFDEAETSPEMVQKFLNEEKHFSPDNWQEIQNQKAEQKIALERDLAYIRNPKSSEKAHKNLKTKPHWLFVK